LKYEKYFALIDTVVAVHKIPITLPD